MAVHAWGTPLSSGLLWAGWVLGGMCAYLLGHTVGRPVLKRLTSTAALARFENRISMQASFGLVLLFQLAVPSEVPGYVLGLARYQFVKHLLVVGIGELPYAIGTVYLGASFLERRLTTLFAIGALGLALTTLAIYALQRRLSAR